MLWLWKLIILEALFAKMILQNVQSAKNLKKSHRTQIFFKKKEEKLPMIIPN